MINFNSNRKYILIVAVVGLVIAGALLFLFNRSQIAEDSRVVHEQFGNPSSFVMYFDHEQGVIEDVWTYPHEGITLSFRNGKYTTAEENVLTEKNYLEPQYNPIDFYGLETVSDISKKLNTEEVGWVELDKEILENAKLYFYPSGLTVGSVEDKVVFIQY